MKLLIDIPKEFEQHFQTDRFSDSLQRLSVDAHFLAGLYEQETCWMLIKAFKNAILVPEYGKLIEKNDVFKLIQAFPEIDKLLSVEFMKALYNLPTIIPAESPKEKTDESTTS